MRLTRNFRRVSLLALLFLVAVGVPASEATSITFADSFEGGSINPFWTVVQQNGTVSLSAAQAHTGAQSAAFSSVNGSQREIHLTHTFASLLTGDASIYFYDAAAGVQTLYEQFTLTNSTTSTVFSLGTMDFDANCYEAYIVTSNANLGPNATCGAFPQFSTTNVARTPGWHLLNIDVESAFASLSIDHNQVFFSLGNYSFDGINILMSGPAFRPNTTAYWDDFNIAASAPDAVPEPSTVLLLGSGLIAARLKRHRRGSLPRSTSNSSLEAKS